MEEAAQITEIETFIPLALQKPVDSELPLQRVVLCGDHLQNSPILQNVPLKQYANLDQSLFARLVRLGVPQINLDQQGRARSNISSLYSWRYKDLSDLSLLSQSPEFKTANAGFRHEFQFVDVEDYKGAGEIEPQKHFVQNLGEAEYAVAIFQYMRLLGYPGDKITILTPYVGQRALIRDVLTRRCKDNPIFGMPKLVTTVDKYQGEQNDYIILSLVRTKRVGYLRDIRRMTVAFSRARLGLYVLGRREVFESCFELQEAFKRLMSTGSGKLELVTGEMWPAARDERQEPDPENVVTMEGVEHLGRYVYEMTMTKVEALKAQHQKGL
jgi:intron-binding protein aquarius